MYYFLSNKHLSEVKGTVMDEKSNREAVHPKASVVRRCSIRFFEYTNEYQWLVF